MAALSAVVFTLSWWLGLYLLARDPRKPVLVLAAIGLTSFASVVALDAVRVASAAGGSNVLSSVEVYLVTVPGIAWFAVLLEMSRPSDTCASPLTNVFLCRHTVTPCSSIVSDTTLPGSVGVTLPTVMFTEPGKPMLAGVDGTSCATAAAGAARSISGRIRLRM